MIRKKEIVDFFREFKKYTSQFAPEKPVMLATNSMEILKGADTYPALLQNLDILCPFGFARMPEGDLTGKEAADICKNSVMMPVRIYGLILKLSYSIQIILFILVR